MKKTQSYFLLLHMIFVVSLVIANVVTGKLIQTGISIFGIPITLPGAAVCYAITFLMTDVIGEIWGRGYANRCVRFGFIGQILATVLIIFTQFLPAVDPEMQGAYNMLLGQNIIFVTGSLVAYLVSQYWDVTIFHAVKEWWILRSFDKHGLSDPTRDKALKSRWIWNNVSTMTSQILDTIIFIGISFGFGFGWFFDKEMWPVLGVMMIGQYMFKFILAVLDTPIFYLLTRRSNDAS